MIERKFITKKISVLRTCDIKTLSIEEIIKQCNFTIENLSSNCVECNEKALQFYVSVNRYMEYLLILHEKEKTNE